MKKYFLEENKLPLTFKYLDIIKNINVGSLNSNTIYYVECKKFETLFFVKLKPFKNITRLL
jgi:hypothetical protein